MNALVNDQLGRLRLLFADPRIVERFMNWAGRPARFARYTSRTLYPGVRDARRKIKTGWLPIRDYYVRNLELAQGPANRPISKLVPSCTGWQELKKAGEVACQAGPDRLVWQ